MWQHKPLNEEEEGYSSEESANELCPSFSAGSLRFKIIVGVACLVFIAAMLLTLYVFVIPHQSSPAEAAISQIHMMASTAMPSFQRQEQAMAHASAAWPYGPEVYAAFIDNDAYLPGLQGLAMSLLLSGTNRPLVVIITGEPSAALRTMAKCLNITLARMQPIANPYHVNSWNARYVHVFSKLNIWKLPARRVIYLDADTLVLKNIDELFDPGPDFRAAKDCRFLPLFCPHRFNAGVMVITPSNATFQDMLKKVGRTHDYDNGDQGFLSGYFEDAWEGEAQLEVKYNTMMDLWRCRVNLSDVSVMHMGGFPKPWTKKSDWTLQDKFKNPGHWMMSYVRQKACKKSTQLYWRTIGAYNRRCGTHVHRP